MRGEEGEEEPDSRKRKGKSEMEDMQQVFTEWRHCMIYLEQHFVQNIDREMFILTSFGESFYLVEVLAFILKSLKQPLMKQLCAVCAAVIPADIHWVITVPEELNQLIREAAGLVSY